jgi:hypothetical protein
VVNMEDGYEQTLFQGRGKTMHRRRRNDRLIFHESEEKEFLLYHVVLRRVHSLTHSFPTRRIPRVHSIRTTD